MALPVQGVAYSFATTLVDASDPSTFKTDPTIVAGDFQISVDDGDFTNLTNLPTVTPSGSTRVKLALTDTEMTGEKITIVASDQTGDEWEDVSIELDVPEGSVESVYDIQAGDHIESSTNLTINKRGTTTAVLEKDITGSLLSPSVTVRTTDAS